MIYKKSTFKKEFLSLSEEKFKQFSKNIGIGKLEPVGIRVPKLRILAKDLAKQNWQNFFDNETNWCMEIVMLKGFVLGYAKIDIKVFVEYLHKYFDIVESWSETDVGSSDFKIIKKYPQDILNEIKKYFFCEEEYKTRLAIIILLRYYLTDDYIDTVLDILPKIKQGDYYVDMAIAWTLSVCFVKFREKTLKLLKSKVFSTFVQNKAVQKCRESFRISEADKNDLLKYKI